MNKILLALLAFTYAILPTCKARSRLNQGKLEGIVLKDKSDFGVMQIVHQPQLKICMVSDQQGVNFGPFETKLKSAYQAWLPHVESFSKKPVINQFNFLYTKDGCVDPIGTDNSKISDLTVVIKDQNSREFVITHKAGMLTMHLSPQTVALTILHEVGHTLGLGDAYTLPSQPISIMNHQALIKTSSGTLYPDDISSLKHAYCRVYLDQNRDQCKALPRTDNPASNFAALNKDGQPLHTLESMGITGGSYVEMRIMRLSNKVWNGYHLPAYRINSLSPDGTASQAGLRHNDLIYATDNYPFDSQNDDPFNERLLTTRTDRIEVSYCRSLEEICTDSDLKTTKVDLKPNGEPLPTSKPTTFDSSSSAVDPNSELKVGDVVELIIDTNLLINSNVVGKVAKGVLVTVDNVNGKWIWIRYYDKSGWIEKTRVRLRERGA